MLFYLMFQLTWADIFCAMLLDHLKDEAMYGGNAEAKSILAKLELEYPKLEALRIRVNNQQGIKKWIETRPKTPM